MKVRKPSLLVNFGHLICSWIRIRIPNSYPDPGQSNLCCLTDLTFEHIILKVICKLPSSEKRLHFPISQILGQTQRIYYLDVMQIPQKSNDDRKRVIHNKKPQ
jgi:hypothetical protein